MQGGVVTLRLLEAEEHREAKGGQVGGWGSLWMDACACLGDLTW